MQPHTRLLESLLASLRAARVTCTANLRPQKRIAGMSGPRTKCNDGAAGAITDPIADAVVAWLQNVLQCALGVSQDVYNALFDAMEQQRRRAMRCRRRPAPAVGLVPATQLCENVAGCGDMQVRGGRQAGEALGGG
jgi:hypothetical protein